MCSIGYPSISGSYSGLLPWAGGVCWALLRSTCEIFTVSSRGSKVAAPSAQWKGGNLSPFCPYFHKADPCILGSWPFCVDCIHGLRLALRLLTRFHSDTFYSSLKTFLFTRARIAIASEYFEEALYRL